MSSSLSESRPIHLILEDAVLEAQLICVLENLYNNIKTFKHIETLLSEPLSQSPACLITEIQLSEIDGITIIKKIREHGLTTPVIIVANNADGVDIAVEAIQAGAADFIERPIVERDFLERVSQVLDAHSV